jgi:hypothetical protein
MRLLHGLARTHASFDDPHLVSRAGPGPGGGAGAGAAGRAGRPGRGRITLHLLEGWHREQEWMRLFEAACGPPAAAA